MLSSIISSLKADDPYEQLISQMIRLERQPQFDLEHRRDEQKRFKSVLDDFDSKLSSLHTLLKTFTDSFSNPFEGRAASGAETDAFSVSVTKNAAYGTHSLFVERLAATDTRITRQLTGTGSDLADFFSTNGAQTFAVSVASPTDADPDHREDISVTVDPAGTTDAEILKEIATAINEAMDAAVTAGTIGNTEKAQGSVINETSDTARLSLRSGKTGYANRVAFTDSADGLLGFLELNNGSVATGSGGGQVKDVGTGETDSALNSKFALDGLTLYRSTNQVSDALDGVTLSLKQVAATASDFSVEPDEAGIEDKVKDFIEKYNTVLDYIQQKARVDADAGTRGDFAGESTFTSLRFSMRNDAAQAVTSQPVDGPRYLTDLGITVNKDGTLELTDPDALVAAVRDDAGVVQSLFAGTDGVATRLTSRLDRFLGIDGILDNRKGVIDDRLGRLDDQINRWDDLMTIREDQLRKQFAHVQESIALFQGQQQTVNAYLLSSLGVGFGA